MTAIDPSQMTPTRDAAQSRRFARITKADGWLRILGLPWITPILRLIAGDAPRAQFKSLWQSLGIPVVAIAGFIALWAALAPTVVTSLGAIPGPVQVWEQVQGCISRR